MNQNKTMIVKMLFVFVLGLVVIGTSNAMDRKDMLLTGGQLDSAKPKAKAKPKAQKPKTKKIQPAGEERNAMLFQRELHKQKKALVVTEYKTNEYQLKKDQQKNKDRLKQERADVKRHENKK
jgi:hypothetical protein